MRAIHLRTLVASTLTAFIVSAAMSSADSLKPLAASRPSTNDREVALAKRVDNLQNQLAQVKHTVQLIIPFANATREEADTDAGLLACVDGATLIGDDGTGDFTYGDPTLTDGSTFYVLTVDPTNSDCSGLSGGS
jgi:hypothetical protein